MIGLAPVSSEVSSVSAWFAQMFPSFLLRLPRFMIAISQYGGTGAGVRSLRFGTAETWRLVGDQISTFLAAILILVPVIALHFVETSSARLTLIVVFTVIFAFIMSTMTGAKRSEIFATTAAFVAVQVVYIGSALTGK